MTDEERKRMAFLDAHAALMEQTFKAVAMRNLVLTDALVAALHVYKPQDIAELVAFAKGCYADNVNVGSDVEQERANQLLEDLKAIPASKPYYAVRLHQRVLAEAKAQRDADQLLDNLGKPLGSDDA